MRTRVHKVQDHVAQVLVVERLSVRVRGAHIAREKIRVLAAAWVLAHHAVSKRQSIQSSVSLCLFPLFYESMCECVEHAHGGSQAPFYRVEPSQWAKQLKAACERACLCL